MSFPEQAGAQSIDHKNQHLLVRLKYAEVKRFPHTFVEHDLRHTGRPWPAIIAIYWPWYGSALINNLCLLTDSYRELVQMCRFCRLCLAVSSLHTYSQHDPKQLRLEIHLPQAPSRVKLGTSWRSVHCQRLLSTVVQLFSCHGPAKVSTADGHSSHVKADKAGPICASKPREEENPNIVLSVPDTLKILKDFTR